MTHHTLIRQAVSKRRCLELLATQVEARGYGVRFVEGQAGAAGAGTVGAVEVRRPGEHDKAGCWRANSTGAAEWLLRSVLTH